MKKTVSLLLIFCMALTIAACGSHDAAVPDQTTAAASETEAVTETTLYMEDDLPDTLDYNGRTVTTFGWSGASIEEFFVEEINGEIINDSIFERNLAVSERLNVDLQYHIEPGANAQRKEWVNSVSKAVMSGEGSYDITAGYSMCGASLASAGMVLELSGLEYLDFEKPWWPDSLMKEAVVGDKLYFASGDISSRMLAYIFGVFFNKKLAESYGISGLYETVTDGSWTTDKMTSMIKDVYSDVNGDGNKGEEDLYGLLVHITYSDSLYFANGLRTTELDSDGRPVLSEDFLGVKAQTLLEKLVGIFAENYAFLQNYGTNGDGYNRAKAIFVGERAIFMIGELNLAMNTLRDTEISYGILPIPKGSETQDSYRTVMSFPYTLYGVPLDAKDPEMSGAVMECLASESYRTVSPAIFEISLKVKYSEDVEMSEMYDIIRGSVVFDFGRIFNDNLSSQTYSLFRNSVLNGNTDWASTIAKNKDSLSAMLDTVVTSLMGE
ncbi:MAG: extracellular solute-binding protein [Clostridiales bacterium]|mgnify:FL=1|nr:extracellular solute-binding protein [Clostridiales bacterium]